MLSRRALLKSSVFLNTSLLGALFWIIVIIGSRSHYGALVAGPGQILMLCLVALFFDH